MADVNTPIVLMVIPEEYVPIYNRLLKHLVDFGIDLVNDCEAGCNANNKKILDCWNMFQSAIAAYNLALRKDDTDYYFKRATFFIKYINEQLSLSFGDKEVDIVIPDVEPEDIEEIKELALEANAKAGEAKTIAENAQSVAENAQNIATNAQSIASGAQSTANTASRIATEAKAAANEANTAVSNLQLQVDNIEVTVHSNDGSDIYIWKGTPEEYAALEPQDDTVYLVKKPAVQ